MELMRRSIKRASCTRRNIVMMLCLLISVIIIGLLMILINNPDELPPLKDEQGSIIPGPISERIWTEIGDIRQGTFIRGENPQNPMILYLHDGPETPALQFITYSEKQNCLKKYFTVCYWDQHGSGMPYTKMIDLITMTAAQLMEDTYEVTEYPKSRFNQDKMYLTGYSWGSYLGIKTTEKYPENYLVYINIGQVTNQVESERLACDYIQNHAEETDDRSVMEKLKECDSSTADFPTLDYLVKGRTSMLNRYGIGHLHRGLAPTDTPKLLFVFRGYTWDEKTKWFLGADYPMMHLSPVVLNDNPFLSSTKFEILFYIMQGDCNYMILQTLTEQHLEVIEAPEKEYFSFSNPAHSPSMKELEEFIEIFREIALERQFPVYASIKPEGPTECFL